jgi:dihydrofolate synthase / folylpolyglutamate synthase
MNYKETLEFLFDQLPMFQRIGPAAYKNNLDNTYAICDLLGNPENKLRCIHVGGTNGKGSTSHILASILSKAGFKTGLYTSPHMKDFRERIRIDGKMIPEQNVIHFVEKYKDDFLSLQPSFFEMTVGMAFDYFVNENTDINVIEVGLGGRLDSTNVISPILSIITNIGTDHQYLLGDTFEEIAFEKAGIIKKETPVIIGQSHAKTKPVFLAKAEYTNSKVLFADQLYKCTWTKPFHTDITNRGFQTLHKPSGNIREFSCDLQADYQLENFQTIFTALDELQLLGIPLSDTMVDSALKSVKITTGLQGRWQILNNTPLVIADSGHNKEGIACTLEMINSLEYSKLHVVIGFVREKSFEELLQLFPREALYYFCEASIPRALDSQVLKTVASKMGLNGKAYHTVQEAISDAKKNAMQGDLIFVGGSCFVVADAL